MPEITVLMPVRNGEKYIKNAIDSVLNQTLTDFEFLIIDDGSTDRRPSRSSRERPVHRLGRTAALHPAHRGWCGGCKPIGYMETAPGTVAARCPHRGGGRLLDPLPGTDRADRLQAAAKDHRPERPSVRDRRG